MLGLRITKAKLRIQLAKNSTQMDTEQRAASINTSTQTKDKENSILCPSLDTVTLLG